MKTKLTLTLEEDLIPLAKKLAKEKGSSLSNLIEESLQNLIAESMPSFSKKWRGTFSINRNIDTRRSYLSKRYKL